MISLVLMYKRVFILLVILIFFNACQDAGDKDAVIESPVDLVYPFLDSAHSRWFFFNSASRPFGMVNLSPDTQTGGTWGSGYRYGTDTVKGFSHIHAWQLAGVEVMPVSYQQGELEDLFNDPSSHFDHQREQASPGYHLVELDRYQITAELTSTARVGFHRYTYSGPKQGEIGVLFNLGGRLGPSDIINGFLNQTSDSTLTGRVVNAPTIRRPKEFEVFFQVAFNTDILEILESSADDGNHRILVRLKPLDQPVLMKIGLSYTGLEQATKNLETEIAHWNFDQVAGESKDQWNQLLSRIEVEGGTLSQRRRFYTDLWHAILGRRIISDVDGHYPDYTGAAKQIKQVPLNINGKPKFNHYNSDAFWGAQWTLNTLWHLVYPEISEEFCNSLVQYYLDGGLIARGPSGGNYTYVMTGASSTPFLVSAWMKGIRGFDIETAYRGMKKNHHSGGMMSKAGYEHQTVIGGGLEHYLNKGYVPYPLPEGADYGFHQDGAGMTLEYAYQDWALAQLALELGKEADYRELVDRSLNYRNLYDSASGWMRPKDKVGNWMDPFDPYEYEHGFNESNAAQASWFVPHDIIGLAALLGGKEAAVQKLERSFEQAEKQGFTSGTSHERELHPEYSRIPINYGNQPSIQTAFIFNQLGRPDLTQYWSRQVTERVYSGLSPDTGYNGDEDQGLMGSLAVLMKIGMFEMNGGTNPDPHYEIGSPIFDKITIKLHPEYYSGKEFVIESAETSTEKRYIQSAYFNKEPLTTNRLAHKKLIQGGKLSLLMSSVPEHKF